MKQPGLVEMSTAALASLLARTSSMTYIENGVEYTYVKYRLGGKGKGGGWTNLHQFSGEFLRQHIDLSSIY
jgi:hypothetical protein